MDYEKFIEHVCGRTKVLRETTTHNGHILRKSQLAIEIDYSKSYVGRIERGERTPNLKYLLELSGFYGVGMDFFFKGLPSIK